MQQYFAIWLIVLINLTTIVQIFYWALENFTVACDDFALRRTW